MSDLGAFFVTIIILAIVAVLAQTFIAPFSPALSLIVCFFTGLFVGPVIFSALLKKR